MSSAIAPLILFVLTSTITPGGATTLAAATGAQFGFRRSFPLLTGISVGLSTLAAFAAAGLSSLLMAAPSWQLALKVAGTAYMLWLAWKIGKGGPPKAQSEVASPPGFSSGVGLLWMNPKAWAMCAGAAASYAALAAHPLQFAALLGAAFGAASALSLSVWCVAGALLSQWLRTAPQWHALNATLALLLVASILPMWT